MDLLGTVFFPQSAVQVDEDKAVLPCAVCSALSGGRWICTLMTSVHVVGANH
jgi:hypothetical protein